MVKDLYLPESARWTMKELVYVEVHGGLDVILFSNIFNKKLK